MKNKETARKVMLALCGVSAALCIAGVVLMLAARSQTIVLRKLIFTVAMVFLEVGYIVRLKTFRNTKRDVVISVLLCVFVIILAVLLWLVPNTPIFAA